MASKDFLEQRSLFDYDVEALEPLKANENNANLNQQIRVPKEICRLIAELIYSSSYTTFYGPTTIYDPACGAAELLLYMRQFYKLKHPNRKDASPYLFGQEADPQKNCMATLNLLKHDCENVRITEGNALATPGFINMTSLKTFDYVVSVLPWKQKKLDAGFYQADKWERFCQVTPPQRFVDWGWMQHILASLKPQGRAAVLVSTGAITRNVDEKWGREQIIRTSFIKRDLIEAVILLPDSLFPDTNVPSMLLLLCGDKAKERRGHIILIDASRLYYQVKPKKILTTEGIENIRDSYQRWETRQDFSKIISLSDAEQNSYNLNPPLYIEKHLRTKSAPHPLTEHYNKLENTRAQHQQIYQMLIQSLENAGLNTLVEARQFTPVLSELLCASYPNLESSYTLFHYSSSLKRIIEQELDLEQEYKRNLLYNIFRCHVFSLPPHQILLDISPSKSFEHIEDIAYVESGGTPSRKKSEYFGGEINWVQIHDLNNGLVMRTMETLTKEGLLQIQNQGRTRPVGTVMIAKPGGASVKGKVGVLGVPAATNSAICCIVPNPPLLDPLSLDPFYLMYYLMYVKNTWVGQAAGALKDPHLKNKLMAKASLDLPSLEQQQKIVEQLKAVSTNILLLEEESEKLKKVK